MTARLVNSSTNNKSNNNNNSANNNSKSTLSDNKKNKSNSSAANSTSSGVIGIPAASTRPSDGRRANKPLMEKRRRARINQSLAVLKTLILDSARLENTKHSKLEKADILELTVRHLQRQRTLGSAVLSKYRAGFQECTREVSRFLESSDLATPVSSVPTPTVSASSLDPRIKQRLLRHLDSCVAELDLDFGLSTAADAADCPVTSIKAEADSEARPDSSTTTGGDENNNSGAQTVSSRPSSSCGGKASPLASQSTAISASPSPQPEMETVTTAAASTSCSGSNPLLSVVQVIPSRLPDGQVVFLLPSHYVQLAAAAAASGLQQPQSCPVTEVEGRVLVSASPGPWSSSTAVAAPSITSSDSVVQVAYLPASDDDADSMLMSDQPIDFTISKRPDPDTRPEPVDRRMMPDSPDLLKEDGCVWRPW